MATSDEKKGILGQTCKWVSIGSRDKVGALKTRKLNQTMGGYIKQNNGFVIMELNLKYGFKLIT